jgi:MarR family 2-MHQ and catechol resistance regulon transcriptional repressor
MNETMTTAKAKADRTIFELLHAAHALEARLEDALSQAGLSSPKFAVLNELVAAARPVALSELATKLSCVKSNMTQLVDRLEADGLVERVNDPKDRRSVKAAITVLGAERQAAGAMEIARLHEEFAAAVGVEDRSAVARMLEALK